MDLAILVLRGLTFNRVNMDGDMRWEGRMHDELEMYLPSRGGDIVPIQDQESSQRFSLLVTF